jgi:hypothetical protein
VLTFKLVGAETAQCRVLTFMVVEALDVLEDARTSLGTAVIPLAIDQLHLQCALPRFDHRKARERHSLGGNNTHPFGSWRAYSMQSPRKCSRPGTSFPMRRRASRGKRQSCPTNRARVQKARWRALLYSGQAAQAWHVFLHCHRLQR